MKSKSKLAYLYTIILFCCISLAKGHEIKFACQYISCNENSLMAIRNEIRSKISFFTASKKIVGANVENIHIEFMENVKLIRDAGNFPVMDQVFVSVTGVSCTDESRNEFDAILQNYIRVRLNGFTPLFATTSIASDEGIEWSGFKIPEKILSSVSFIPVWFSDFLHLRDGSTVKFFDDGHIRRYLIINKNSVESEFALDIRDTTNDVLRLEARQSAFSSVKRKDGEMDRTYFLSISEWLYKERQVIWISPYEIPFLGQF